MSLYSALNSAVSGLQAQSTALSAISANIANASTTGYKTEDTSFESLVAASSSTNNTNTAYSQGVSTSASQDMSEQGEITSTSTATNMAINGTGFFVVSADTSNTSPDTDLYTRDGSFSTDSNGYLINNSGDYLMGYSTDADGNTTAAGTLDSLTAIQIPSTTAVSATTEASLTANLPSDLAVGGTATSSLEVVDSLGVSQTITETWTKTASNSWSVAFSDPYATGGDSSTTTGSITSTNPISVSFDSDGKLTTSPSTFTLTATSSTGASDLSVAYDLSGLTQYASSDSTGDISVTSSTQNGSSMGSLSSVSISDDGLVSATYSNGTTVDVAKVPIATFANQEGLSQLSGSTYEVSSTSGSVKLSTADTDGAGSIEGSALESSTTDTATEFNKMIVAQQAYSAAAQVVTYVDKMFNSLIQAIG